MEEIENDIYQPETGINKCSLDILFQFLSNKLEYYEHINDPILQALSNWDKFDHIIESEQSKDVLFFFFVEKLSVKFYMIKTGLLI